MNGTRILRTGAMLFLLGSAVFVSSRIVSRVTGKVI